ncbi:GNAT family N-acetyltransferase [Erysipelothrix rhusiopathiae subsp. ohloneorum]|nr:GNAT family N-acetyltransferase [Erysipelothrix rhusiopathiae]
MGGAFVVGFRKEGGIGAIFLAPDYQGQGFGRQTMLEIERMYPKVKKWKLDTPSESFGLHKFYENLGYVKTGEIEDPKSDMKGFVYKKNGLMK